MTPVQLPPVQVQLVAPGQFAVSVTGVFTVPFNGPEIEMHAGGGPPLLQVNVWDCEFQFQVGHALPPSMVTAARAGAPPSNAIAAAAPTNARASARIKRASFIPDSCVSR